MLSTIFTLIIGGASIYFFYENNFFVGILLLIWTIYRLFGVSLQRLVKGLGELISHSELERKCNVSMELSINVEEVLKHSSVEQLFKKLKEKKIIHETDKGEWIKKLLNNYKKKYKTTENWEKVKFNIKNNLVFKNEKIDFNDSVYHELYIPYEYKEGKEEEESFFTPRIETGLTIRIFIVNGIIKLQIGDLSKEYTPKMLRDGGLAVYQTHETITSFPLMYFSYQHKIPENYLNLSAYATESWKNLHADTKDKKKDFTADWKELNKEIRDYNYVCNLADEYVEDKGKWEKIVKGFNEKKEAWLKREEFKNPFAREKDDDWYDDRFDDNNIYYVNKFLNVFIANYNDLKEKREKYVYTDYYEERP